MEKLKSDISKYRGGFENLMVSLHKVYLDVNSKVKSAQYFDSAIKSGKNGLMELDRLIAECMKNLSENEDLQEDLMQLLVSYRPRLENEINLIEDAIKNPTDYADVIHDDELDQVLQDAQAELLEMLQDENERIEMAKREQMRKKSEIEQLENQRLFEQQQQMKDFFKNYQRQQQDQQEPQKNSWLQEGELQSFHEMKRKNFGNQPNFGLDNFNNFNSKANSNNNNNNYNNDIYKDAFPIFTEKEEENTDNSYQNEQEIANRLLSQFLGVQIGDQGEETQKEETQKEESQNEETQNEESQNEETQKEETQKEETQKEESQKEESQREDTQKEENKSEQAQNGGD